MSLFESIRMPYLLGGANPPGDQNPQVSTNAAAVEDNTKEIEDLKTQVTQLSNANLNHATSIVFAGGNGMNLLIILFFLVVMYIILSHYDYNDIAFHIFNISFHTFNTVQK